MRSPSVLLWTCAVAAVLGAVHAVKEASLEDLETEMKKTEGAKDTSKSLSFPRSVTQFPSWLPFHKTLVDEAKDWKERGGLDLLFVGDSITETWRGTDLGKRPCIRCNGVEDIFEKEFGHLRAAAFGISRDQAPNLLWRLQDGELPQGLKVKVVVVLVGTFDVATQPLRTWQQTRDGIKAIVAHIRETVPEAHVVPMAILPRNRIIHVAQAKTNPIRANITLVNKWLLKEPSWKNDTHVHFLDCTEKFLDGHNAYIVRYLMPDFVHPSDAGHKKWVECLKPVISEWLPFPEDRSDSDTTIDGSGTSTDKPESSHDAHSHEEL